MDRVHALQDSADLTSTPLKISSEVSTTPAWAEEIIRLLEKQNEYFAVQSHITELNGRERANGQENLPIPNASTIPSREVSDQQTQVPRQAWVQILEQQVDRRTAELLSPPEKRRFQDYTELTTRPQPWNEWAYRSTYAYLTQFLQRVSWKEVSRVQVSVKDWDVTESQSASVVSSCTYDGRTSDLKILWGTLRQTAVMTENPGHASSLGRLLRLVVQRSHEQSAPFGKNSIGLQTRRDLPDHATTSNPSPSSNSIASSTGVDRERMAFARIIQATDVSPAVCTLLLGSASSLSMSNVVQFFDRHLSFTNWGNANLLPRSHHVNSYVFEYHFACYYVSADYEEPDLAMRDIRRLRRSAVFRSTNKDTTRLIYEEQRSFLLYGYSKNFYTCYQLADRYYKGTSSKFSADPTLKDLKPEPNATGSHLFLTWLHHSFHHLIRQWDNAITSIDAQTESPDQVIFVENDINLLADDTQFSRSRTYFWALHAYKMFEERLTDTIRTWENFKETSLDKVNNGMFKEGQFLMKVKEIDRYVAELQKHHSLIEQKVGRVVALREGLVAASTLFDNRTTIQQGDNIKLLTYITLLFLPLTFSTSIFGMQTILPPSTTMQTFATILPIVTIVTGILIFNLHDLTDIYTVTTDLIASWIRKQMLESRGTGWKSAVRELESERASMAPITTMKSRRPSAGIYILFLLESIFITLPVQEVTALIHLYGFFKWLRSKLGSGLERKDLNVPGQPKSFASKVRVEYQRQKEAQSKRNQLSSVLRGALLLIFSLLRGVFILLWAPIVLMDFVAIFLYYAYVGVPNWGSGRSAISDTAKPLGGPRRVLNLSGEPRRSRTVGVASAAAQRLGLKELYGWDPAIGRRRREDEEKGP